MNIPVCDLFLKIKSQIINLFFSIRLADRESEEEDNFENSKSGLKTLNLRLDEVAHIRSALTKATWKASIAISGTTLNAER